MRKWRADSAVKCQDSRSFVPVRVIVTRIVAYLKDDGTGILVHSFSGDDPITCKDHVRQKLGLPVFTPRKKSNGKDKPRKIIVAEYDYTDESGALLFQVVRFEPKNFRQRKPDGNGKWTWKLGEVRRVLFKLPEIIEGMAAGHPVFIVEGEKDVVALNKFGIIAANEPRRCRQVAIRVFRNSSRC